MSTRLASSVIATALMRRVQNEGGNAAVLRKGDATSGTILIVTREKGDLTGVWERLLNPSGAYFWVNTAAQPIENTVKLEEHMQRRIGSDPDLWVIELDIPDAPRFIAELAWDA